MQCSYITFGLSCLNINKGKTDCLIKHGLMTGHVSFGLGDAMTISNVIGTHIISNEWMNFDSNPATNAPGHKGYNQLAMFRLAADGGADSVRIP